MFCFLLGGLGGKCEGDPPISPLGPPSSTTSRKYHIYENTADNSEMGYSERSKQHTHIKEGATLVTHSPPPFTCFRGETRECAGSDVSGRSGLRAATIYQRSNVLCLYLRHRQAGKNMCNNCSATGA